MTTFRNLLADPLGTRRGPPLVRGPQFEYRWDTQCHLRLILIRMTAKTVRLEKVLQRISARRVV